jgi:hypothetical protein
MTRRVSLGMAFAVFLSPVTWDATTAQDAIHQPSAPSHPRGATMQKDEKSWKMPPKIRFCDPTHCGTLTRRNGRYDAVYDDDPGTSFYAFGGVTADSLTLHRVDQNGRTAVLEGTLSSEGNSIVNGVMTWDRGESTVFNMAWGSAINTVVHPRPVRTKH